MLYSTYSGLFAAPHNSIAGRVHRGCQQLPAGHLHLPTHTCLFAVSLQQHATLADALTPWTTNAAKQRLYLARITCHAAAPGSQLLRSLPAPFYSVTCRAGFWLHRLILPPYWRTLLPTDACVDLKRCDLT